MMIVVLSYTVLFVCGAWTHCGISWHRWSGISFCAPY